MLIPSYRHRESDLELWRTLEESDLFNATRMDRRVDIATQTIREFVASKPAYCGVSWGKDSVVVAHLCWVTDRSIPLIHLRPSNHNPDCDSVRDDYMERFPGQLYREVPIDYGDLHSRNLSVDVLDKETDKRWYQAIRSSGEDFDGRHILGIRSGESNARKLREKVWGESSPNGCAPITRWSTDDVFAYLAANELPVHPAYAMLGNGRWSRERLRVAEIGDTHGTGGGRREWEMEYYGDVLRRIEQGSRSATL